MLENLNVRGVTVNRTKN